MTSELIERVGEYVWGISPVLAALRARRRTVHDIYLLSTPSENRAFERIRELAKETNVTVRDADKEMLNLMTRNGVHQGAVLDATPLSYKPISTLPAPSAGGLWLALDEVTDPQNLGALIRSGVFFGVAGFVVSERNMSPLSAVVSKASAGAMESTELHQAEDLALTLMTAQANGWSLLGTGLHPKAVNISQHTDAKPSVLLMGNEGAGIRPHLLRMCDRILQVPHSLQTGAHVSSLNVSVAAGILLHLLRERLPLPAAPKRVAT